MDDIVLLPSKIWRPIKGFEDLYLISSDFDVFSVRNNRTIATRMDKDGYVVVTLHKNGEAKTKKLHRIIYESFVGEIPSDMTVDHKDWDTKNNAVQNLQLLSVSENSSRKSPSFITKITKRRNNPAFADRFVNASKEACSKKVYQYDMSGNFIMEWPSASEAERSFGSKRGSKISACCRKMKGRKSAHGYKWSYEKY